MPKYILILICFISLSTVSYSQTGKLSVSTFNTPLYTLFSPITFAKNAVTTTTAIPSVTQSSSGNILTLTDQTNCEGAAATFNNTFNPSKDWQLRFTYTLTTAGGPSTNADGIAVSIHKDARGTGAVGGSGSSLGCDVKNPFCGDNATAIRNAMDWEFEVYSGAANYGATLKTSNNVPAVTTVSGPALVAPVVIATNTPIDITMRYTAASTSLAVVLNDGTNTKTFTYTINLASVVGSTGYLAFTAATGGSNAGQTITRVFMYGYPI